jgi:hypothetical protein
LSECASICDIRKLFSEIGLLHKSSQITSPRTWSDGSTDIVLGVVCEFKNMDQPKPESEQKCSLRGGVRCQSSGDFRADQLQHKLYPLGK